MLWEGRHQVVKWIPKHYLFCLFGVFTSSTSSQKVCFWIRDCARQCFKPVWYVRWWKWFMETGQIITVIGQINGCPCYYQSYTSKHPAPFLPKHTHTFTCILSQVAVLFFRNSQTKQQLVCLTDCWFCFWYMLILSSKILEITGSHEPCWIENFSVLLLLCPFHAVLLRWLLFCLLSDSISTQCCICFLTQSSTQHTEWAEQLGWYSIGLKSQVQY